MFSVLDHLLQLLLLPAAAKSRFKGAPHELARLRNQKPPVSLFVFSFLLLSFGFAQKPRPVKPIQQTLRLTLFARSVLERRVLQPLPTLGHRGWVSGLHKSANLGQELEPKGRGNIAKPYARKLC